MTGSPWSPTCGQRDFAREGPRLWRGIDRRRVAPTLVFLESSEEALVRRFSETRRPHPLRQESSIPDAIRAERELLADLRGAADLVLDTSEWSAHEMRSVIYRHFGRETGREPEMAVSIVSFGFKHGAPAATDLLFDVRFLANPHYVPELRPLRGDEEPVLAFLRAQADFAPMVERLADLMLFLLPRYRQENRSLPDGVDRLHRRAPSLGRGRGAARRARCAAADWHVDVRHRDVERVAP